MGRFGTWRLVDMMCVVQGCLPNGGGGEDGSDIGLIFVIFLMADSISIEPCKCGMY